MESLHEVLKRLARASLTLNLAKGEFGKGTVVYLGRQVGGGQVRPVKTKVVVISQFLVQATRRERKPFLGMIGYYWAF